MHSSSRTRFVLILASIVGALVLVVALATQPDEASLPMPDAPQGNETTQVAESTKAGGVRPGQSQTACERVATEEAASPTTQSESAKDESAGKEAAAKDAATRGDGAADDKAAAEPSTPQAVDAHEDDPVGAEEPSAQADEASPQASEDMQPSYVEFEMPEGASYVSDEVLIEVDPGASVAEVEELLARTPGIAAQSVMPEAVEHGQVLAELEPGVAVEDAVNAVRAMNSPVVTGSQPDYLYYTMDDLEDMLAAPAESDAASEAEEVAAAGEVGDEDPLAEAEVEADADADALDEAEEQESVQAEAEQAEAEQEAGSEAAPEEAAPTNPDDAAAEPHADEPVDTTEEEVGLANDPNIEAQWGLESMRVQEAWTIARSDGENRVGVAVIDDSFQLSHPDLAGNVAPGSAYNAAYVVAKRNNATWNDRCGTSATDVETAVEWAGNHGTHVMGIVGAVTNNQIGIAGVAYNAQIVPIQAFSPDKDGNKTATTSELVESLRYVCEKADEYNIKVVNMSLGAKYNIDKLEDQAVVQEIRVARSKGIVVVCAAGNKSTGLDTPYVIWPGDCEAAVSVINLNGSKAGQEGNDASGAYNVSLFSTSNYNTAEQDDGTDKGKNISAPGTRVTSTVPANGYRVLSGTSMAAPQVAGVLALEFAANPELTSTEAIDILYSTAHDLGDEGWDCIYGHGEADALAAVTMASGWSRGIDLGEEGKLFLFAEMPEEGFTYDGTPREPTVRAEVVKDGRTHVELVPGEDFEVRCDDNVNAGTVTATVVGIGAYEGLFEEEFHYVIARFNLTEDTVALPQGEFTYDACPQHLDIEFATPDGIAMAEGVDYTRVVVGSDTKVGSGIVRVEGLGNYCGTVEMPFSIVERPIDAEGMRVSLSQASFTYTGKPCKPAIEVTHTPADASFEPYTLAENADYELTWDANTTRVGTKAVLIRGKGNYTGTVKKTYKVTPVRAKAPVVTNRTYTGSAQVGVAKGTGYTLSGTTSATNVGQYRAYATLSVGYTWADGSTAKKTLTWKVTPISIAKATIASLANQPLTGSAIKPKPVVTWGGRTLKEGKDYTLAWSNNVKVGTATVTVTGKGNYTGTKRATFKIVAPSVSYRTHVQTYGTQAWKKDGQTSGTTGESKRLEGIWLKLGSKPVTGSIEYRTHVQTYGWESGWKSEGAMSGTHGQSKRLEAIQIRLTGNMAKHYDVWYRVHAQTYGWLGWAKNGASSGTQGQSKRLEGIQIVLVPKGAAAPGSTANAFRK